MATVNDFEELTIYKNSLNLLNMYMLLHVQANLDMIHVSFSKYELLQVQSLTTLQKALNVKETKSSNSFST